MKKILALCLALACAGFMASALLAASTGATRAAVSAVVPAAASALAAPSRPDGLQDAGAFLPAPSAPQAAPQMSSANFALDWSAVGEISGGASTSTNYKLNSTIGQMAANTGSASANFALCTGFECVANALSLYLPLIHR